MALIFILTGLSSVVSEQKFYQCRAVFLLFLQIKGLFTIGTKHNSQNKVGRSSLESLLVGIFFSLIGTPMHPDKQALWLSHFPPQLDSFGEDAQAQMLAYKGSP